MQNASRRALTAVLVAALGACESRPRSTPQGYLFEKGPYQGFYAPNGKLIRLLYDENGDKKAEVVMLFYPNGRVSQAEVDTNKDGVVDRWQYFMENGALEKEGFARRKQDTPDLWQYFDKAGQVERRELDEDGDGQVDRIENHQGGRLISVGIDSDRDGKMERWQTWVNGRVSREELDVDGDAMPDRRLRYGNRGNLVGVDTLTSPRTTSARATAQP